MTDDWFTKAIFNTIQLFYLASKKLSELLLKQNYKSLFSIALKAQHNWNESIVFNRFPAIASFLDNIYKRWHYLYDRQFLCF